jgi:PAS domain S-box-containing protein
LIGRPHDDTGPLATNNRQMARGRLWGERAAAERLFKLMADAAPMMIWQSGPDKGVTYLNKPWLEFTGRSAEQEVGDGWAAGVHPADLERCMRTYTEAFERRQPFEMEYRLRRQDGAYRWILDRGRPFEAPSDEFLGYIGGCIDITERKRNEAKKLVEIQDQALQTLFVIGLVAKTALTDLPPDRLADALCAALVEIVDLASTGMAGIRDAIAATSRSVSAETRDGAAFEQEREDDFDPLTHGI